MSGLTRVPSTVYQVLYPLKPCFRCPQARHFVLFCWMLTALALDTGSGTIKSLSRLVPARVTYWAMMRMVRSGYWDPDELIAEEARLLLLTLPRPSAATLFLLGDATLKGKRGKKHPLGKTTRMNQFAPFCFGFEMVVLVAAWGRFRIPVAARVVDPRRKGRANILFRNMLRAFEPPTWAKQVIVEADAGFTANATIRVIRRNHWDFVFAVARTRKFTDGKTLKDLATHLPKSRYRRVATHKPNGRRRDYWIYRRRGELNGVGDVTIVLSKQRRNSGPKGVKIIVTNLEQASASQILSLYAQRWSVEVTFKELKSGLHLGRMQVTKDPKRVERSVALSVLAYQMLLRIYGHEEPRMKEFTLWRLKSRFAEDVAAEREKRLEFRWRHKLKKLKAAA